VPARWKLQCLSLALPTVTLTTAFAAAFAGYLLGLLLVSSTSVSLWSVCQASIPVACIYTVILFLTGYEVHSAQERSAAAYKSALSWILTFVGLVCVLFFINRGIGFSRAAIATCFSTGLATLPPLHAYLARRFGRMMDDRQIWLQKIGLISLTDAEELQTFAADARHLGIKVVYRKALSPESTDQGQFAARCPTMIGDLQSRFERNQIDAIWIMAPFDQPSQFDDLKSVLSQIPLPVVLVPNSQAQELLRYDHVQLGNHRGYVVQRAPLSRRERALKRCMDVIVASLALFVLAPIFLFTTLAILVESGRPVLFRQDRLGFGGRAFKILKFRSMTVEENGATVAQAVPNDSRVTRLGRILRRSSIDEIPQFINVLKGDMSIVGPRPHAVAHDHFYGRSIASYAFRRHVKPGITGWAQINGLRGNTADLARMECRVEHDLWYVNHWSPWLDLKIIVRTALVVLWQDEAC
jgi:Undecaprenyl-phosphate glucose phosphotransferase